MIGRLIQGKINARIGSGKAIILTGPRQTGKTTLIRYILDKKEYLFLNGDDITAKNLLENSNTYSLKQLIGKYKFVFIDEAQRIRNIGLILKLIIDQMPDVQVFVTGSSSFELGNQMNEPLTGRKWEYNLFPISWSEYEESVGLLSGEQSLDSRLIYGMYPDVINNLGDEAEILKTLSSSYLYKDILAISGIKKPDALEKLVQALAYQIGNEVSYNELAQLIGIDKNTVGQYIDVLEKAFVIFKLPSFSRNLRNEIKKNQKIYFFDNGIRNAIIGNFSSFQNRQDNGSLWENFVVSELYKHISYSSHTKKMYFWRTSQKQEIDVVITDGELINAYEIKLNSKARVNFPKTFINAYNPRTHIINKVNFRNFILSEG
jgi:hypothetical protein